MLKLDNFIADMNKRGHMRANRFTLAIELAPQHYLRDLYNVSELTVRCDSATIPGVQLATIEGPYRYGYGPLDKMPYAPMYSEIGVSFVVDRDSRTRKFFHDWTQAIVNTDSSNSLSGQNSQTGAKVYEVGYRKRFESILKITTFDENNKDTSTTTIFKAYPVNVSQVDVAWGATDDVVRLTVAFAYKDYTTTFNR